MSIRNYTLQERERKSIAGDLHDQLGQLLTGILLQTDFIAQCNAPVNERIAQSTSAIRTTTRELMSSLRNITDQLRPILLDQLGLIEALQDLISQWQVLMPKINFDFSPQNYPNNVSDLAEISIYRIVQETLTNACKHAKANTIRITIDVVEMGEDCGQKIALHIEDDGVGFDPNELHFNRLGLINMRERTEALNGTFKLMSRSGCGVSTHVTIPLQEHIEEAKC